jgi:hypothetical protein
VQLRLQKIFIAIAACMLISAWAASAQTVIDPITGFSIAPPDGYSAALNPTKDGVGIVITANGGTTVNGFQVPICRGLYFRSHMSDNRFNSSGADFSLHPRFRMMFAQDARPRMSPPVDMRPAPLPSGQQVFPDRVTAAQPLSDGSRGPEAHLRTPNGYITFDCAPDDDFAKRQSEFEAMIRSIDIPD